MSASFEKCVKEGGKVITISAGKDKYFHVCYPKGSNKPIKGEMKTKKK